LKTTELEDYVDVFREFETKKRSIKTNQENKVVITLPLSLTTLVKKQHTKLIVLKSDNFGLSNNFPIRLIKLSMVGLNRSRKASGEI
jgi:hypothetical protein